MENIKTIKNFLIGGCIGVTIVNIGKIIANFMRNMFVEETQNVIPILLAMFILYGITFIIVSYVSKTYIGNKSEEEIIEKLRVQLLISIIFTIISIILLIIFLNFIDYEYVIAIGLIMNTFIFITIALMLIIRELKKTVVENKED